MSERVSAPAAKRSEYELHLSGEPAASGALVRIDRTMLDALCVRAGGRSALGAGEAPLVAGDSELGGIPFALSGTPRVARAWRFFAWSASAGSR